MRITGAITLAMLLTAVGLAAQQGFVPLFDGKDLSRWKTSSSHWVVEDGVLALKDRTDGKEHNDSYLWTAEMYGDFVLDLEFKVPPERANSGVFLRTSDLNDPVQTGIEVQVGNPRADGTLDKRVVGGIYELAAPGKNTFKPGEWNRYVITCKGARISVELNGELVSQADLDQFREPRKNPDGTPNKFTRALKDFARRGYIGLQDHGRPVWYRNIRVRRLD